MSLIFYSAPMSTASITELVLAELGVPHEKVTVDIPGGGSKRPEFLKVNPNGKVPALVHDGVALWESAALTLYLGETFGVEKKLYPPPGPARGEAMKWVVWTNVTFADAVGRWARNTQEWLPAEQRNAKAGEVARADIDNCLRVLDEGLAGKQFLCGDYTVVDTHLTSFLDWLKHMKVETTSFKNLTAWNARCTARPVYQKWMNDAMAAMTAMAAAQKK